MREGGRGGSRRDSVVTWLLDDRLMQRGMGGKEGQGCGGEHGFGYDGRGADDGCDGLGDHVGGGQRRSVAEDQRGGDRSYRMVGDNTGQTAGCGGSDGQDGGENSLRGKRKTQRVLLYSRLKLLSSLTW